MQVVVFQTSINDLFVWISENLRQNYYTAWMTDDLFINLKGLLMSTFLRFIMSISQVVKCKLLCVTFLLQIFKDKKSFFIRSDRNNPWRPTHAHGDLTYIYWRMRTMYNACMQDPNLKGRLILSFILVYKK